MAIKENLKNFLLDLRILNEQEWKECEELITSFEPKYDSLTDQISLLIYLKKFLSPHLFETFLKREKQKMVFRFVVNAEAEIQEDELKKYLIIFADQIKNDDLALIIYKAKISINSKLITFFVDDGLQINLLKNQQDALNFFFKKYFSYTFSFDWKIKKPSVVQEIFPSSLPNNLNQTSLECQIFKITRNKVTEKILNLLVTDYEKAFQLKLRENDHKNEATLDSLKVDDWIKVTYSPDHIGDLEINELEKIDCPETFKRFDHCKDKRTEIIMHTNMSAFDGLNSPTEIIKCVKNWGWTAIGVTDLNCVQAFPEFALHADQNFKVIYGVELNVVPKEIPIVLNAKKDEKFADKEYVIFDLETTGLHPGLNDIIEFGGIKYKGNETIKKVNFLIKTNEKLSSAITQKTHIKDSDLEEKGITITEALERIINFIGDATLIAHNGILFDFPFLNAAIIKNQEKLAKKLGHKVYKLKNEVIDTMRLSQALDSDNKLHNLEALSRRYDISYNSETAHRADVDAEVLYKLWEKLLERLKEEKISTADELNKRCEDFRFYSTNRFYFSVFVYAKNKSGLKRIYSILSHLLTEKKDHHFSKEPRICIQELLNNAKNGEHRDLIIVNNPIEGDLINYALIGDDEMLEKMITLYDFVTVSPAETYEHKLSDYLTKKLYEEEIVKKIIQFCKKHKKPCIATSDAYYLHSWQKKFHEVLISAKAIGGKRHRFFDNRKEKQITPLLRLHTSEELIQSFSFLNDEKLIKEIVIDNSQKFVKCFKENLDPIPKETNLFKNKKYDKELIAKTRQNAKAKYGNQLHEVVSARIDRELDSIIKNGYSTIYWISHLLVEKSEKDGYPVGSRGSIGSSLVAMLLNISEINPLPSHYLCDHCHYIEFTPEYADGYDLPDKKCPQCHTLLSGDGHNIPFETFMGLKGEKAPDIDLNFSGLYQARAHEFVREQFGREHTLRAGTVTTIAEKTAFGFVKTYFDKNDTISNAEIAWYAKNITGVKRTTGQHPGGIIIFPKKKSILDFTPYNYPADDSSSSWYTTHFSFEYLHDVLLKFDILGHDDPSMIRKLDEITLNQSQKSEELKKRYKKPKEIPHHDEKVLEMFTSLKPLEITSDQIEGETTGVIGIPEFGTAFVRRILKTTFPKSFADLVRISGLSHGTNVWKNNAERLIRNYQHIKLSDVIACRDDIMNYLMSAGVEPSEAFMIMENIRKGIPLKTAQIKLMRERNVPEWYIDSCKKIKYLFPKAHAVAYVLMAWRIAWYKCYWPLAYYAAHFTYKIIEHDIKTMVGDMAATNVTKALEKIYRSGYFRTPKQNELINTYEVALEMFARGIKMSNISLSKSDSREYMIDEENNQLIPPFIAIPGLGEKVADLIISERQKTNFKSIEDFKQRTKATKTNIEDLKELGVLSSLSESNTKTLFD